MKIVALLVFVFVALSTSNVEAIVRASPQQIAERNAAMAAQIPSPVDVDPDLTQLAIVLKAADIRSLFKGTGPFTGFFPNNAAFEKLGKAKMDELLLPENKDKLVEILLYHVIPGTYLAKTVKTENVKTVNGKELNFVKKNGEVTVNGAKIVKADQAGPNGVVQIIDTVLIP